MVLKIVYAAITAILPQKYIPHIVLSVLVIAVVHAFVQGRSTDRERDLHGRVVLLTGGFTPVGVTLLQALAERGAHIIALSSEPVCAPGVALVVELLRTTTGNENVYAEDCDISSPASVKRFCAQFLASEQRRLDAIVFAHEYNTVGSLFGKRELEEEEKQRETASLATFLIVTLLLPSLLIAPVERDIRIINVINPFYAAAIPSFSPALRTPQRQTSVFLAEGRRSLRMAVFTRHLQRVLDALPSGAAQVPKPDEKANAVPVVSGKAQRSNIVAVSVCPGISRSGTVPPLFGSSRLGFILYALLRPLLWLFARSSTAAIQSVLHVLFLPTPFKAPATSITQRAEVLKPGALYRECAVVRLHVPVPPDPEPQGNEPKGGKLEDDGEIGGEVAGRLVWESLEIGLKAWEKDNPAPPEDNKANS